MKCEHPNGCLTEERCEKAKRCLGAWSEGAAFEPAGLAKVVAAVAIGSLPVPSADLLEWLTRRGSNCEQCEAEASENIDYVTALRMQIKAQAFREVLYYLRPRTEAVVTPVRQPEENGRSEPTQPPISK